jgi:serine/threonine-protein kinase
VISLGLRAKPIDEILEEKGMVTAMQADQLRTFDASSAMAAEPVPTAEEAVPVAEVVEVAEESSAASSHPAIDPGGTQRRSASGATRVGETGGSRAASRSLPVKEIAGFRLLEHVGAGSNGIVYKAIQLSMNRPVALKILAERLATNKKFVERFMREARVVARLNHPNIIGGIDVGEENGLYYFAMEFADGRTVREMLERGGALDERQSMAIVMQIAKGLDQAYRVGLIHRDIKPDNIIITKNRVAKLLDLGLARESGENVGEAGKTFGTPNYISPEQARGDAVIDTRSDIYSLGATLYHMLTGQTPFQGNPAIVMAKHISEKPHELAKLVPGLHPETVELVETMMAKDPAERHQSPQELMDHVEGVLDRLDPAKAGQRRPEVRPRRRRRRL